MKKKFLVALLLTVVLCFSLAACNETTDFDTEMLTNGNFEAEFQEKVITGWTMQNTDTSKVVYSEGTGESKYININNKSLITSNLYQEVKLEKGATYKVTAKIRINTPIASSTGFSIGFLENTAFAPVHFNSTDGWEEYVMYFTPEMNTANLCLRLSGKGGVSIDDVSLTKIRPESVPAGASVYTLKVDEKLPYSKTAGGITLSVFMVLLTAVVMAFGYYALRRNATSDKFLPGNENEKIKLTTKLSLTPAGIIALVMASGFLIRFVIAMTLYGYDNVYNSEAANISQIGISAYYFTNTSVTPPGYIYYLSLYGLLRNAAGINSYMGISVMLKLPSILADLGIIYMLFSYGRKYVGDINAGIISLLYAVLPPVFMLNSGWGGTESLALICILGIFISILEKKHIWLLVSTILAVLFSFEAVYILPMVAAYLVVVCIKDKKFIYKAVLGVLIFFVAFYLLTLPMSIYNIKIGNPMFMFKKYYNVLAASAMACLNNFSLFALIGLNNKIASEATFIISIIFVIFVWAYSIYLYVLKRNRLNLILVSAFTMLAINTFAVNQTNAMAVIGTALLLFYAMLSRDKRVYMLTGGFFTLNALNIFSLLDMAGYIGNSINRYVVYAKFDWVQMLGSALMIILIIALMYVCFDIASSENRKEIQPLYDTQILEIKKKITSKFRLKKAGKTK